MGVTSKIPHFNKIEDYTKAAIDSRCDWLEKKTGSKIKYLRKFSSNPKETKGNIEKLIGMVQVPVGITGPLLVKGDHAKGEFYVPMATTEGALITDYDSGMRVATKSGGLNVTVLSNSVHISPVFQVKDMREAREIMAWVKLNFIKIKDKAEKTTENGKLLTIMPIIVGRRLILKFCYDTKDAQGMNMINNATEAACKYIEKETHKQYYLRSKYSSIKIAAQSNIHKGYGREVFVDGVITRKALKLFYTTPEELYNYYTSCLLVSIHSGILGMTAHIANAVTAIYVACGQDIADVSTAHIGISMCEITENKDLYISLYMPNLLVGTIGGGTGLSTQKECLKIMDCYGSGNADKFAEIVGASCLAGELSVLAAVVTGVFVSTHEKLGRNKI